MTEVVARGGQVIGFDGKQAVIRLENAAACGSCSSRGGCGSAGKAAQVIRMPLSARTRIGDRVSVAMPASSIALAAVLGYLLPPSCLLIGAIAGATSYGSDAAAVMGAGLGLVAGLLLARLISHFAFGRGLQPSVCGPASPYGDLQ